MMTGRTAVPRHKWRQRSAGSEASVVSVHSGKCGFSSAQSGLTWDPAGRGEKEWGGAGALPSNRYRRAFVKSRNA